ncbi:MAG TPA: cbb3-type cytochrome oxidase assembly protein CcoS [bacterium]|nr:cbb3-type cytochrome oxidase assembly protein CcoS [bacterium]
MDTQNLYTAHFMVIFLSVLFGAVAIAACVWSIRHGHFQYLEGIKYSIFDPEDDESLTS